MTVFVVIANSSFGSGMVVTGKGPFLEFMGKRFSQYIFFIVVAYETTLQKLVKSNLGEIFYACLSWFHFINKIQFKSHKNEKANNNFQIYSG